LANISHFLLRPEGVAAVDVDRGRLEFLLPVKVIQGVLVRIQINPDYVRRRDTHLAGVKILKNILPGEVGFVKQNQKQNDGQQQADIDFYFAEIGER